MTQFPVIELAIELLFDGNSFFAAVRWGIDFFEDPSSWKWTVGLVISCGFREV